VLCRKKYIPRLLKHTTNYVLNNNVVGRVNGCFKVKKVFILSMIILILVPTLVFVVYYNNDLLSETKETKPFYVGVTYCGNSTDEAKLLIDKVKNYSNLFVLQSGSLQEFPDEINEIGDYAISSGMYFIVYFGSSSWWFLRNWLETCEGRWGDWFLGVYYGDELGGKMLDAEAYLWDSNTNSSLLKYADGRIQGYVLDGNVTMTYSPDGIIELTEINNPRIQPYDGNESTPTIFNINFTRITYYPNDTIVVKIYDPDPRVEDNYNITYTYEELWNMRPFQTYDETAGGFVEYYHKNLVRGPKNETVIPALISDYALYWFDYKAGYDVVLAQFGWNHTLSQDIALVRGAAELQNKKWGAIITWKYNHPPYLDSGEAIYNQMRMAYKTGAEYVVIFNYAEDMEGPYGTLQEEHFMALERFWNEVVQSPEVEQGSIKAEAALVLPENYGWGMRNPEDKIWGLWGPDEESQQIWELSRSLLEQYGVGLDIVYEDATFPVAAKYPQIYYWNYTN
jgi:hypothetical protein